MGIIFGIIHVMDIVDCIQQPFTPPATYHPHKCLQLLSQLPGHSQSMGRKLGAELQAAGGVNVIHTVFKLLFCMSNMFIMEIIFGIIHVMDIVDCIQQPFTPPATYHPHKCLQLLSQLPGHSQSIGRKLGAELQAAGGVNLHK